MTGVNTGLNGCPLSEAGTAAVDRIREIGSDSEIKDTEGLYLEGLELCGRVCLAREICLGINNGTDSEVDKVRAFIEVFRFAANIGADCEVVVD